MAIVDVVMSPSGTSGTSLSSYVAAIHKVLEKTELNYQLTPMSTIIEGDLDEIIKIIREMQETLFDMGVGRVNTNIRIDDRRDKAASMAQKLKSVKEKLNL